MPGSKIEDELGKKISNFIEFIPRYFKTLWFVLIHPQTTFNSLLFKENKSSFTKPETFLGINIILSISIATMFGYSFPDFPFQPSWLHNSLADLVFLIIRFLLGVLVLLFLIKWLIGYRDHDSFIKKAFPILCYGSALYVVNIIASGFSAWLSSDYFYKLYIKFMYALEQHPIDTNYIIALFDRKFIIYLLISIIPLLIFLWWFLLIYYGLKSLKINSTRRTTTALIFGIMIFCMLSYTIKIIQIRYINASTFKCIDIIKNSNLDREILGEHSSWLDAAIDANIVVGNNMIPEAVRYPFLIKRITFIISLPIYNNDKILVAKIMNELKKHKYEEVEEILNANNINIKSGLDIKNELKKAKSLRQSPDYFKLSGKTINIISVFVKDPVPISPDLEIISGMNFLKIPLIKPGKIISIFP